VLHRFAELDKATSCVLEVGAGRGTYSVRALAYMPETSKLILTDASKEMVSAMKTALPTDKYPRVQVQQVNAIDLPFLDGSVDTFAANLVLHHTSDSKKALCEAFRVLKAGGRLCLAEVDASNSGTLFSIIQQSMKIASADEEEDGRHHDLHSHNHAHQQQKEGTSENKEEDKFQDETQIQNASHHNHNHDHALRHGGAEELRRMILEAGFVNVVAWHLDCIAETSNADRFAEHALQHAMGKANHSPMDAEKQERVKAELRCLAQMELDAGRPIVFGTVILTAYKPS